MPRNAPGAPAPELPAETSDEALFEGVRRGSEAHFNAFYERTFARVYGFVFSRVRNHADAEELTQETFTVVFRSASSYGARSTPMAWVYGIAKNTVHNHLRRGRLQSHKLEDLEPARVHATQGAWASTPEEDLTLQECLESWQRCLSAITPWQFEVFRLRHLDDLSIDEIAERMDRSNDAVRSSLYRVKRMLVEASGEVAP